jgi:glyoxylase-like metal-dependent hydrolase (beta-lactamase superfamily II)
VKTREALVTVDREMMYTSSFLCSKHGLNVKYILSTHAHIDHVGDLEKLKVRLGRKLCFMNETCRFTRTSQLRPPGWSLARND